MFSSVPPPPPQDGIIQDQDCDDNPYAPGCPQSGGQEGQGPPPEGRWLQSHLLVKVIYPPGGPYTSWWTTRSRRLCK